MENQDPFRSFAKAMYVVYGDFDSIDDDEVEKWIPPDNPGAGGHRGRYLWTDAFGVVNFITLYRQTTQQKYLVLAKRLVQTVHDVLGRTRDGSARLSDATDEEPLKGGLRIGKVNEKGGDGDGQYHHYLTLWMFALNRLTLATEDAGFNDDAVQLARAIHPHFVIRKSPERISMVWKISADMETTLTPSEGHLDPATGLVIYRLLQETAARHGRGDDLLKQEISDYRQIMAGREHFAPSGDLLDLGMGLWISHFAQDEEWASRFADEALRVASDILADGSYAMRRSTSHRLAFRELGACLGVACSEGDDNLRVRVDALIAFWGRHLDQTDGDLRPISLVMYSAALISGGKNPNERIENRIDLYGFSVPERLY